MSTVNRFESKEDRGYALWYGLATALAVFTYFFGLGSDHIPKNGDEFPYAHLTRVTARSGHLLPLRSEIPSLNNTKPPMLFWQGIASTNWGKKWTLWDLRYPSVIYTLLTAGMVFLLGSKLASRWDTGFAAMLVFLAFFSTYRYGRPFLTDPPDVFWLFLPFFVLLCWKPASFESRCFVPLGLGVAIGLGLFYKSFALAVPVLLAVAWWYLHHRSYWVGTFLERDAGKLVLMGGLSLAVFSLWFVFDPDPYAIVREFILGENMAKFDAQGGGYVKTLLWGGSSIWSLALGYPLNAGLLALPVVALAWVAYRRLREMTEAEKLLWIWVLTLFFVFSLPSQRSERYLLPAMPALAVLCALNWDRIDRRFFGVSLIVAGVIVGVLAYLSFRLQQGISGHRLYAGGYWALLVGTGGFALTALLVPRLTRPGLSVASLLVFLCFAAFLQPFDGPLGRYGTEAQELARGKEVWVPVNFKAKEEGFVFMLPGAKVRPYTFDAKLSASALAARYPLFAVRVPISDTNPVGGKVIGQRLELGSRHSSRQIMEMIKGKVYEHLFLREVLVQGPVRKTEDGGRKTEAVR